MSSRSEPTIVQRDAFQVAGIALFGDPRRQAFRGAWDLFDQFAGEIPWMRRARKLYGLQIYPPSYPDPFEFTYLAGVEAPAEERMPPRCVRKYVPAAWYAVFEVRGGPGGIDETYRHAYRDWLPSSGYVQAWPHDFEEYDRPAGPEVDPAGIRVWIPVRAKD